jgi:hypothetical protein
MEPKTKKILAITSLLLVIGGVVGFLLYKKSKEKKEEENKRLAEEQEKNANQNTGGGTGGGTGGNNPKTEPSVLTSEQTKAFQDWLDAKYPQWLKGKTLNKGSGYGTFGPSTKVAYATYGAEWTKSTTSAPPFDKDGFIRGFRDAWSKVGSAPFFIYQGIAYDSKTGQRYLELGEGAIGKFARPKVTPGYAKVRSATKTIDTGPSATLLGKINYPNYIGTIKNTMTDKDKSGKSFRWYEVTLAGGLAQPTPQGQYSKTGWVREDAIDIVKA